MLIISNIFIVFYHFEVFLPWLVWLSGLSTGLWTESVQVMTSDTGGGDIFIPTR